MSDSAHDDGESTARRPTGATASAGAGQTSGHPPARPGTPGYRPARRGEPLQRLLFGGVYGSVLAGALAAALGGESGPPDPGYDAVWVLAAAVAASTAHGYAHAIAHRTIRDGKLTPGTLRSVLQEWALLAAAVPTVAALLGAYAGWWGEDSAITTSLVINTAALFGWGLWAGPARGTAPAAAVRRGLRLRAG
ncbi:hypothetical protein, partial [Streptomyces sp. 8L]|uniref:hypothetical protein n=1 Tax=Streptomyces sp. 8L TaxID=2877242 RepID=UPI001CD75896